VSRPQLRLPLLVLVPALVAFLLAGCGGVPASAPASAPTTQAWPVEAVAAVPRLVKQRLLPAPIDPGTLPQTYVRPTDSDPAFLTGVQALWRGIVDDDPAAAMPFFFPRTAYVQVKAIWNPLDDYQYRLVALYSLDIQAAHAQLGPDPETAQLVGVQVPAGQAEWIVPGVEYNKGSYYRVYGTRLTYQADGQTRSFGIFSLISWRGEWYVVHLGPSSRSAFQGEVFQPM
jgi:hypothetical protein